MLCKCHRQCMQLLQPLQGLRTLAHVLKNVVDVKGNCASAMISLCHQNSVKCDSIHLVVSVVEVIRNVEAH